MKKKPGKKVFFQDFTEQDITDIVDLTEIVSYSKDDHLFKLGDESNAFYIISTGELEVYTFERGERVTIALIKSGSVVGEIGFLDDQERSASARAMTDLVAMKFTKDTFLKLEKTNIKLAIKLILEIESILADRLRNSNKYLVDYQTVKIDDNFMNKMDISTRQTI